MNSLRALQKSAGFVRSQGHLLKSNQNAAILSYLPNSQILNNRTMATPTTETSKPEEKPTGKSGSIGKDLLIVIGAGGIIGGVLFAYMEYRESKGE